MSIFIQLKIALEYHMIVNRVALSSRVTLQCPQDEVADAKAAYKSGEIRDISIPITLDIIKTKLKDSGVFDWEDPKLNSRERKELGKLFDAVEIMTSSRNRQPAAAQNMFSSLRLVERVVKKQLKEGQISESLAAKFDWDSLKRNGPRPSKPKPKRKARRDENPYRPSGSERIIS